jgi:hypothetical protein
LNPIVEIVLPPCGEPVFQIEEEDNNMFNVGTSIVEYSWAFIILELSLFQKLFIP